MMNREHKHSSVGRGKFQFNCSCTGFKKRYLFNQGQPYMWPRLQGKQTPTTQSDQYIYLILSFRHEKYETMSDLWHQPFILSDEWEEFSKERDIFLMSASISHTNPPSFSSVDAFSLPTSCLTFPRLRSTLIHPPPRAAAPVCVCTGRPRCKNAFSCVGFFPGPGLCLRANTGSAFCDLIGWLVPQLQHASEVSVRSASGEDSTRHTVN